MEPLHAPSGHRSAGVLHTGQAQALQWAVPVQVQALEIAPPPP